MVLQVPVAGGQRQRRNGRRREWGDTLQSVFVATTEVARAVADMPACMHACTLHCLVVPPPFSSCHSGSHFLPETAKLKAAAKR